MPDGRSLGHASVSNPTLIRALTRNGYTRTPRAEADIRKAISLTGRQLAEAFAPAEGESTHLCAEALVFFIREQLRKGERRSAERLFALLVARCQRALRTMIRGVSDDGRYDIQADVLADLARLLLAVDDSADFLEARFWLYLRRRATTARSAWLRSSRTYVLDDDSDDGRSGVEDKAVSLDLSPEDLNVLRDALERLPPELRELVILKHYEGWRVGDEGQARSNPMEPTLSEKYEITPRAVRKRLAKAEALLTRDQEDHP